MSVTASAIAIIIALILFFILCYRGVGIIPCSILCAAVVALTNRGWLVWHDAGQLYDQHRQLCERRCSFPLPLAVCLPLMMTATGSS